MTSTMSLTSAPLNDPSSSSAAATSSTTDIWTQILLSVQTAKSTPLCPVVILGEPHTGKSSLIRHLAEGCPSGYIEPEERSNQQPDTNDTKAVNGTTSKGKKDLALAYAYCDVPDDEGEDILARMSIYTLYSSSHESLLSTIPSTSMTPSPFSQPLASLKESLFVITLDWTRPQAFLDELRSWIVILKDTVRHAADRARAAATEDKDKRQVETILQEMKDAVESYIRSYTPPGPSSTTTASNNNNNPDSSQSNIVPLKGPGATNANPLLPSLADEPLEEGILDDNLGINLVVILTKADTLDALERNRNYKEEQFDYIQQVLRTICLKYGAALFSVAQTRQSSFDVVRKYLLHRITTQRGSSSTSTGSVPFNYTPLTIERDVLLIPAGWDTWGKIKALRDDFSPTSTARGWEWDCKVAERHRANRQNKSIADVEKELQDQEAQSDNGVIPPSACRLWEDVIGEYGSARGSRPPRDSLPTASSSSTNHLEPPDAQAFLASHFASIQKESSSSGGASSDPRAKFGATAASKGISGGNASADHASSSSMGRSIVGPMQSSGLSGPAVERFMTRSALDDDAAGGAAASGSTSTDNNSIPSINVPPASTGSTSTSGSTSSTRPKQSRRESSSRGGSSAAAAAPSSSSTGPGGGTGGALPSPGGGATKQSEVLQSFFQDLLRGKSGSPGGGGGSGSASGGSGAGARRAHQQQHPKSDERRE